MADAAAARDPGDAPPQTLADKINWLIDKAHPAGRGPYSNAEVSSLIEKVTGEQFSHTTIWKLRNGQATNPQMRLIEALARTFAAGCTAGSCLGQSRSPRRQVGRGRRESRTRPSTGG